MIEPKGQKGEEKPVEEIAIGTVEASDHGITPEEEKRLRRKIDCVVLPIVSLREHPC